MVAEKDHIDPQLDAILRAGSTFSEDIEPDELTSGEWLDPLFPGPPGTWVQHTNGPILRIDGSRSLREIIGEFSQRYNDHWILERHGYRTSADVRRDPLEEAA